MQVDESEGSHVSTGEIKSQFGSREVLVETERIT